MKSGEWVQATPDGVSLLVKVIPRAGTTKTAGIRDGRLLVRLAAAPVEGAANDALIGFLAEALNLPRRSITLLAGASSRNKHLKIAGVDVARVTRALLPSTATP
jgi:uncharacterized protein (TIGR00251 family)